jgi:tetratricopeptide (TPR) repeat protein
MAIFLSFALDKLLRRGSLPNLGKFFIAILPPLIIFSSHFSDLNRRNDFLAPRTIQNIFSAVPQNGILITSGDTITGAAMFEQIVSGERKDLLIVDDRLYTHLWYKEKKKKEMEAKNIKFADNLPSLIKENKDREIYSISNSISFLATDYDFFPFGVAYKIFNKGAIVDTRALKEKNDALWQNYIVSFLKDKDFDVEYFSKEVVGLYLAALNNLAAHLANHNYVDAAIDYLERSLEIRENKNALYNLAGIYGALGDRQKAAEYNSRIAAFQ